MRKLKPAEVVALAALLSIGGMAEAQDVEELPITNMNSVNVMGYQYQYQWGTPQISYQSGPPASGYGGGVGRPQLPNAITKAKALDCAKKYSGWAVPPGYQIGYSNNFAWTQGTGITTYTAYNTRPFGSWSPVWGIHAGPDQRIWIFAEGFSSFMQHFITIAHELAHAGGITNEGVAESQAQAAYTQYIADAGAKCGGLAPP
nr:hypothetical protein [uncultured Pseudoxanthomonas sp.]